MEWLSHTELQAAELNILIFFDHFCKTHGLRYSLAGGTLLGAVRHKGFIPWDDDIDVMMPRPDFEKFIELFSETQNQSFFLYSGESPKYPFAKLLSRDIAVQREGINDVPNLWIDIFPVDGLPEDEERIRKIYKKNRFYIKIICFAMWKSLKEYRGRQNKLKAFLITIFVKIYGVKRACQSLDKLAKKIPYGSTKKMGIIAWGMYGPGEKMPLSGFDAPVQVDFEGYKFMAVSCWHEYLSGIYGNYMQLPPEEKRVAHDLKAYRINSQKK